MSSSLFYRYYDTLFSGKDYSGEVSAIFQYCAGYPLLTLERILEIGCGTGSHTLELAKKVGVHVTAVDVDAEMLALAQLKVKQAQYTNISLKYGRSNEKNVDLCVALFNVVNYICEEETLSTFFTSIAGNLRQGGLLIFDCWNGAAALLDPPGSKMYEQQSDGHRVSCHLASLTELSSKITTLNYQIDLFDSSGRKIESESHSIKHKLWTPEQIKAAICEAGFTLERLCLPFRFDHAATDSDWKIMFVCLRSDS